MKPITAPARFEAWLLDTDIEQVVDLGGPEIVVPERDLFIRLTAVQDLGGPHATAVCRKPGCPRTELGAVYRPDWLPTAIWVGTAPPLGGFAVIQRTVRKLRARTGQLAQGDPMTYAVSLDWPRSPRAVLTYCRSCRSRAMVHASALRAAPASRMIRV